MREYGMTSMSAMRVFIALIAGLALLIGVAAMPSAAVDTGPTAATIQEQPPLQTNATPPGQVRGEPDFDVFVSDPWIPTGQVSTVTLDLLNKGDMSLGSTLDPRVTTARSLTLEAETDSPLEVRSQTIAIGDVPPGQPRGVPLPIAVPSDVEEGEYEVDVELAYHYTRTIVPGYGFFDSDRTDEFTVTVIVDDDPAVTEQDFDIENLDGSLEVGYSGEISGTITNDGPEAVDDAVLVADPQTERIHIGERQYALPELAVNESAEFTYFVDVSGQADPGFRQVHFTTQYDEGESMDRTFERVEVAAREPEFSLNGSVSIPAGQSRQLELEVTNNRPETLSSINVGLYADSPLTAVDDGAFIDELAPGESAEIVVELSAAATATPKVYPAKFDFRYDNERGSDRISEVYQHPVEVTPAQTSGGPGMVTIVGAIAVVALLAGGLLWYRRQ